MSLIFPHNPSIAAKQNFAKLLVYGTQDTRGPENLTTSVGLEAIKDRREAELGMCHQVKKFTASLGAYTVVLGTPVAGIAGGAYYLLKDYISDPSKVLTDLTSEDVYCPFVPESISYYGGCTEKNEIGMFNGKNLLLGLATLGLADRAIKRATGFAPIGSVMSWTAHMASSALLYAAYKAGEMTTSGYSKQEKDAERLKATANKTIFEQTKAVFDNIADDLNSKAENFKNDPKALLQLKGEIQRLQDKMDDVSEGLKTLKLGKSEELQILDKLNTTIGSILNMQFILRHAENEVDHKYNAELMAILSEEEFEGKELPFEVTSLLNEIKANKLGFTHAIKANVLPLLAGAVTVAATGAVVSGLALAVLYHSNPQTAVAIGECLMNNTVCKGLTNKITTIVSVGLAASGFPGGIVHSYFDLNYRKIEAENGLKQLFNENAIRRELFTMFNGIASYVESQKGVQNPKDLKMFAANIYSKIPQISIAIEEAGITEDASQFTESLEKVLVSILKTNVSC